MSFPRDILIRFPDWATKSKVKIEGSEYNQYTCTIREEKVD